MNGGVKNALLDPTTEVYPHGNRLRHRLTLLLIDLRPMIGELYGGAGYEQYLVKSPGHCSSFTDPRQHVLRDLNRMALYAGAFTAQLDEASLNGRLDPGIAVNYSTTGYEVGSTSIFHTDYWFFLGAAVLELICIFLVAPT